MDISNANFTKKTLGFGRPPFPSWDKIPSKKQAPKAGGCTVKIMLTTADLVERCEMGDWGDMGDKHDKGNRDDKGDRDDKGHRDDKGDID